MDYKCSITKKTKIKCAGYVRNRNIGRTQTDGGRWVELCQAHYVDIKRKEAEKKKDRKATSK